MLTQSERGVQTRDERVRLDFRDRGRQGFTEEVAIGDWGRLPQEEKTPKQNVSVKGSQIWKW